MSFTGFRNATRVTRPQSTPSTGDTCGARGNNSSIRRRGLRLALFRTSAREGEGVGAHGQNDVWSNCEVTRVRSKVHLSDRSCTTQQRWLGNHSKPEYCTCHQGSTSKGRLGSRHVSLGSHRLRVWTSTPKKGRRCE